MSYTNMEIQLESKVVKDIILKLMYLKKKILSFSSLLFFPSIISSSFFLFSPLLFPSLLVLDFYLSSLIFIIWPG